MAPSQYPAMCQHCDPPTPTTTSLPRRHFLKIAGAATLGLGLLGKSEAANTSSVPKPQNAISPDAALERLMKGNGRYISGNMKQHDFEAERPALSLGQNPFAGILSCADSRIAPEFAFDAGRGDVFVCRVAGNFADGNSIGSFEFGVAVLGLPFIMVLGHNKCGAIDSAIAEVRDGAKFPGHIPGMLKNLRPAVKDVLNQPGDLENNAIAQNVRLNVEKLKNAGPILSKAVEQGKLKIVGGVYDLYTGRVNLIS